MDKVIKKFICSRKKCSWKWIEMLVPKEVTEITCGCKGRAQEEVQDD